MKLLNFLILIFIYSFLIGGCAKDAPSTLHHFYYEEPFKVNIEEEIFDSNQNISIKIISIIEDSRSQKNTFFGSEGRLRLEFELKMDNKTTRHYITYQRGKNLQKTIEGIGIKLTNVFPENQIDEEIKLEEYVFTMLVQPT